MGINPGAQPSNIDMGWKTSLELAGDNPEAVATVFSGVNPAVVAGVRGTYAVRLNGGRSMSYADAARQIEISRYSGAKKAATLSALGSQLDKLAESVRLLPTSYFKDLMVSNGVNPWGATNYQNALVDALRMDAADARVRSLGALTLSQGTMGGGPNTVWPKTNLGLLSTI